MSRESKAQLIERILTGLRAADGDMDRLEDVAAASLAIHRSDFRCLDLLSRGESLSPTELGRRAGLSAAAVTALLDRLEEAGYVRRLRDSDDRRRVLVEATPDAIATVWPIFQRLIRSTTLVLERFNLDELRIVARFVDEHRKVLSEQLAAPIDA